MPNAKAVGRQWGKIDSDPVERGGYIIAGRLREVELYAPEKDGVFERKGFWACTAVHKILGGEIHTGSIVNYCRVTPNCRTKKTVKQDKEDWIIVPIFCL